MRLLFGTLPSDMPSNVAKAARDEAIRDLATRLVAASPEFRRTRLAHLISEAGFRLDTGRRLDGDMFDGLQPFEIADVEVTVGRALSYAPQRSDGSRWLGWRRIFDLLAGMQL